MFMFETAHVRVSLVILCTAGGLSTPLECVLLGKRFDIIWTMHCDKFE